MLARDAIDPFAPAGHEGDAGAVANQGVHQRQTEAGRAAGDRYAQTCQRDE
jgi:hypothetical protein